MFEALVDVASCEALRKKDRIELAAEIGEALGDEWTIPKEQKLTASFALLHKATKLPFVIVPGGEFEMGITPADITALKKATGWNDATVKAWLAKIKKTQKPVSQVSVQPFITMTKPLDPKQVERLSDKKYSGAYCYQLPRVDALAFAKSLGFRVPTEAEYEWLARDGGVQSFTLDAAARLKATQGDSRKLSSRFGVTGMFDEQWTQDGARGGPRPEYVEDPNALAGLLAGYRLAAPAEAGIRLTRSLD